MFNSRLAGHRFVLVYFTNSMAQHFLGHTYLVVVRKIDHIITYGIGNKEIGFTSEKLGVVNK